MKPARLVSEECRKSYPAHNGGGEGFSPQYCSVAPVFVAELNGNGESE